ncbi:hypothetical protein LOZ58_001050 [Ophidiomyces ophidiicola]|nr:hypothetical protein LOZ58_001050 [Ophidiomyces ophidiicola]
MAMKYFKNIKEKVPYIKKPVKPHTPILSDEEQEFLSAVVSSPEKTRGDHGGNAQVAIMDGAQNIPLPMSPCEENDLDKELALAGSKSRAEEEQHSEKLAQAKKKNRWSWMKSGEAKTKAEKEPSTAAEKEVKKEEEDISEVLEKLNLAAVNNRVFSVSDETQDLLEKFKFVFKDLVNGVPTAYNDLESLLKNGDRQLQSSFNKLPDFLQKLIEQLPDKVTKKFAPEILAAAAERAEKHGLGADAAGKAAGAATKMGLEVPSLKELVARPAAIAGMLRSIITFLKARFPALLGVNVLWSLALMVLLMVLWYCHKRGREERLERERLSREASASQLETADAAADDTAEVPATASNESSAVAEPREAHRSSTLQEPSPHPATGKNTRRKTVEPYEGT